MLFRCTWAWVQQQLQLQRFLAAEGEPPSASALTALQRLHERVGGCHHEVLGCRSCAAATLRREGGLCGAAWRARRSAATGVSLALGTSTKPRETERCARSTTHFRAYSCLCGDKCRPAEAEVAGAVAPLGAGRRWGRQWGRGQRFWSHNVPVVAPGCKGSRAQVQLVPWAGCRGPRPGIGVTLADT